MRTHLTDDPATERTSARTLDRWMPATQAPDMPLKIDAVMRVTKAAAKNAGHTAATVRWEQFSTARGATSRLSCGGVS